MKTILQSAALACIVALGTTGTALANGGGNQTQSSLSTGADTNPLRGVRGVLKLESLTATQRAQIESIIRRANRRATSLRQVDSADRARAARAIRTETRSSIYAVLTPAQRAELSAARAAHPHR